MREDWLSARHSPIDAVTKISRSLKVIGARIDPNAGLLYVHLAFFAALAVRGATGRLKA